jgi:hypothetical protein
VGTCQPFDDIDANVWLSGARPMSYDRYLFLNPLTITDWSVGDVIRSCAWPGFPTLKHSDQ